MSCAACAGPALDPQRATSKIARVLGDAAEQPPDVPRRTPYRRAQRPSAMSCAAAIVRSLRQLSSYDPAIRRSDDPEAVHKARVATRRLRSDLRTFRPVLDRAWSEPLRAELQWLGRALGRVRDADVLLDALAAQAAVAARDHQPAATRLRETLDAARRRDRDALLEMLDSDRYAQLLDRLVAAARSSPGSVTDAAGNPPRQRSPGASSPSPRQRFERQARGLDRGAPDPALHEARKRAKQVRYASEALAPLLGKRARVMAERFADGAADPRRTPGRRPRRRVAARRRRATPTTATRRSWRASSPGRFLDAQQAAHARSGLGQSRERAERSGSDRRQSSSSYASGWRGWYSCIVPAPGMRIDVTSP